MKNFQLFLAANFFVFLGGFAWAAGQDFWYWLMGLVNVCYG